MNRLQSESVFDRVRPVWSLLLTLGVAACEPEVQVPLALVPLPAEVEAGEGSFAMDSTVAVGINSEEAEVVWIAEALAGVIGRTPDSRPPVVEGSAEEAFSLLIDPALGAALGPEGYRLDIDADGVRISAGAPAGLFYGVQTVRQLLPPVLEYGAALPSPVSLPHLRIEDRPRFEWRGAMLDVSRHFFTVAEVQRFIDLMALHKLNRLHLHLSDDQGWRIEIPEYPALTEVGGTTEVGGGPGGYYTTEDYESLVRYAADRFITIVPEIDLPGHTNAALASVPELNCDGEARDLYIGIAVGFSTVCVDREETYTFVDAVVEHLASITPGPWLHLGGDEVEELTDAEYREFIDAAEAIVHRHGKAMIGWQEIAAAELDSSSVLQIWHGSPEDLAALRVPGRVILSPATHTYLDIKYDEDTPVGLTWAGLTSVKDAYELDPAALIPGLPISAIAGLEAPLWTETLDAMEDLEFMAFPRLAALAERAWSPEGVTGWESFRARLGLMGLRWTALGVNYYRTPEVEWAIW